MKNTISATAAQFAAIALLLVTFSALSHAQTATGTAVKTCAGQMKVCEGGYCSSQYFYFYGYQYAYVYAGEVQSETHEFSFDGALGNKSDYVMKKQATAKHVFYQGPKFALAIPFHAEDGVYVAQGINGPGGSGWNLLCK